ncbi:M14 family metallopeptidase [Rhodovibrionaceae bacterium A322]
MSELTADLPPALAFSPDYFATSYAQAREKFQEACQLAGLECESYTNPLKGPRGEDLATDVTWIGPRDAERVLVTQSATHGIEGYCGSGVQVGSLLSSHLEERPENVAIMMIHAINPFGFAWSRRVNEDNVDLNRNFQDFSQPLPQNPRYDEVHAAACPENWTEETQTAWTAFQESYIAQHGTMGLQAAISSGQYHRPDGLFYGGIEATWSNKTLHGIVTKHLAQARHVAVIDYHTGLGPYGYGERISKQIPGSVDEARLSDWYRGDFTNPASGTSSSARLSGTNMSGIMAAHPDKNWTCITLEFGTLPVFDVLNALRADNWLHSHGDLDSDLGQAIKREIRQAFYGETNDWKEAIWNRGIESQRLALRGLAAS